MANKPLRMGILGCGGIANRHAKSIVQLEDYRLAAFCDVVRPSAERFQKEYGQGRGDVFEDYHEMFQKAELDVVTICLPPFAHRDEVEAAAQAGCHILIEKPIALTNELAGRMTEAVEKAGVKSQVGFMMRFMGGVEEVRKLLAAGQGPLIQYVGRYLCNALHAPWWRRKEKSGGQMVEQIIHQFDLCRYLLGEPREVFACAANLAHREVENYSAEDVSGTVIQFASGAIGVLTGTNCAVPGKWLAPGTLVAKGFVADWGGGAGTERIVLTGGKEPSSGPFETGNDTNRAQHEDLLRAIREDGETRTPMREGAETLRLVLAARESSETGKPVRL